MAESGTSFSIDLAVKADGAQSAAEQLDAFAQRLEFASKAADSASAAMKAGEASYRQAEASYNASSKALERINVAMETASGAALDRLQTKHAAASAAVDSARVALEGEAIALDRLRESAAAADSAVEDVTAAQQAAKDAIDAQKKSQAESNEFTEKAGSALGALGGPLGAVGQKALSLKGAWDKLGKVMGAAGPYAAAAVAIAAIAAAVIAVTVAVIEGALELTKWAVGLANARRSNELLAAGMVQSAEGGRELNAAIGTLAGKVPQTADELRSMAAELAKTGLRGKELTDKLEENAVAAAKLKFGPEWQKQMLSLDVQQRKFKTNLDGLFGGLKIEKLLEGLSTLVDLFDENTASGKAIKVVFESIFQPAIDGATGFIPAIRHAFLQFEILVLKAMIAIKPWGSTLLTIGKVIGVVAAVTVGLLAVALGVVIGLVGALVAVLVLPIVLFAALAAGVVYLANKFMSFGKELAAAISAFDFIAFGKNLIAGLAQGIAEGAGAVVNAVKSAADGAITAAKKALGIASPSKVFAEIGLQTAAGMQGGVEGGAADVQGAMTDLASPSPSIGGAPSSAAPASGSGSVTYQITIQGGGSNAEDLAERVRQVILDLHEGAAIQLGGVAAAGAT